ncbi:MAG: serine hydrolase domain-containing protein [Halioglobus sp.]
MKPRTYHKFLLVSIVLLFVLSGCRTIVTVPEGGRVYSESGNYECTSDTPCTVEVADTTFNEVFRAEADPGFVFVGWKKEWGHICSKGILRCEMDASVLEGLDAAEDILSTDIEFYLEPVFEAAASMEERLNIVDAFLQRMNEEDRFNGAILVGLNGEPLLLKSYGYSDVSRTELLSVNSSFRLASVSKQFTATAIMILEERDMLAFSDLLSDHVPEFDYPGVTIEHLLHHTSGIQDLYNAWPYKYIRDQNAEFMSPEVFYQIAAAHPLESEFDPGSQFRYSNTGYVLLAEIVSRISGQTFENFLHDEVFSPLEMNDTDVFNHLSDPNSARLPNRAKGFSRAFDIDYDISPWDGAAGDGAVFSSVADFIKWDQALRENTLVSVESQQRAFTSGVLNDGSQTGYGYGWFVDLGSENSVSHSGGWLAARTWIHRDLAKNLVFVLLENSDNGDLPDERRYIDQVVFSD